MPVSWPSPMTQPWLHSGGATATLLRGSWGQPRPRHGQHCTRDGALTREEGGRVAAPEEGALEAPAAGPTAMRTRVATRAHQPLHRWNRRAVVHQRAAARQGAWGARDALPRPGFASYALRRRRRNARVFLNESARHLKASS